MVNNIDVLMPQIKISVQTYCYRYSYLDFKETLSKVLFEIAEKQSAYDTSKNVLFSTYIFGIVNGTLKNYLKTEYRYISKTVVGDIDDSHYGYETNGPDEQIDEELKFHQREKVLALIENIRSEALNNEENEIVNLHFRDSMNVTGISEKLNIDRRKVKSIIEDSLNKIRESMITSVA
jgi:RNA polymerase sigma factor (sigma-70 family)